MDPILPLFVEGLCVVFISWGKIRSEYAEGERWVPDAAAGFHVESGSSFAGGLAGIRFLGLEISGEPWSQAVEGVERSSP